VIPPQLRRLILRLAGENPTEDRRIHRERTQLGDKLAASTMSLLQRAGMESAPRRAGLRWVWLGMSTLSGLWVPKLVHLMRLGHIRG
jgi:hypothetical protein